MTFFLKSQVKAALGINTKQRELNCVGHDVFEDFIKHFRKGIRY